MKTGTVVLKMRDGSTEEKSCILVDGLAVHSAGAQGNMFGVSHAPSGMSFGSIFMKKTHATNFAKEVAALYDTNADAETLMEESRNRGDKPSVHSLARKYGAVGL